MSALGGTILSARCRGCLNLLLLMLLLLLKQEMPPTSTIITITFWAFWVGGEKFTKRRSYYHNIKCYESNISLSVHHQHHLINHFHCLLLSRRISYFLYINFTSTILWVFPMIDCQLGCFCFVMKGLERHRSWVRIYVNLLSCQLSEQSP